jgi:hypothetical protein
VVDGLRDQLILIAGAVLENALLVILSVSVAVPPAFEVTVIEQDPPGKIVLPLQVSASV